jgi:hypothetical protein
MEADATASDGRHGKLSKDNRRLRAGEEQRDVEIQTLCAAKEAKEYAMAALQQELAIIKLECQVAMTAVKV